MFMVPPTPLTERVIAPRLSASGLDVFAERFRPEAPGLMEVPFTSWLLVVPALPVSISVPPPSTKVELLSKMLATGAPLAEKSRLRVPPFTFVAPV